MVCKPTIQCVEVLTEAEKCRKEKTLVTSEFDPATKLTTIYLMFISGTLLVITSIFSFNSHNELLQNK